METRDATPGTTASPPPALGARRRAMAADLMEKSAALIAALGCYPDKTGRFVLFGSVARGDARGGSDVDLLIDFPERGEAAAFAFVEENCAKLGIRGDLRAYRYCSDRFLSDIAADAKVIQP
jgi:predicted nucleotidyltransferase